jgi:hypothetical protein
MSVPTFTFAELDDATTNKRQQSLLQDVIAVDYQGTCRLCILLTQASEDSTQFLKTFDLVEGSFDSLTFEKDSLYLMPLNIECDEICYLIKPIGGSTDILMFTTETIYTLNTEPLYRQTEA